MNENISDVELERFLRRRDRISQEYAALPAQGPAAELDAAILERARRALEEAPASGWWRSRWPRNTALAATVVLSFAAIVRLAIETDQPLLAPLATRPQAVEPTSASVPDAAAPRVESRVADESVLPATPAAVPGAEPIERGERPERASKSAYSSETPMPAPQPASPPAAAAAANASALRGESLRSSRDVAQVAQPPAEVESPREADVAGAESAQHGAAETKDVPLSDEARRRLQKRAAVMAERAKAVVSKEAVAPLPPRTPRPPHDTTDAATVSGSRAAAAPTDAQSAAAPMSAAEEAPAQRDAATWLRDVERLRAEGRFAEAARELERLREAYPDYEPARALAPTR